MQGSFSISMTGGVAWTEQGEIPKKDFFRFFQTSFIFRSAPLEVNESHSPNFFAPLNAFNLDEGRDFFIAIKGDKDVHD